MQLYTLQRIQRIQRPLPEVYEFFSRPENLRKLTPDDLALHILTPSPIQMKEGALIDYTIRIGGIPVRWTTMITDIDPGRRFVDVQLRGPYAYWHHTHRFSPHDGGTVMSDEVLYALPLGGIGRIMHALYVRRRLEAIFTLRARRIEELFSGDGERSHIPGEHLMEGESR